MKLVYASRTGNIEKVVGCLGYSNTLKLVDGNEVCNEDYIIFTYTDGNGIVPEVVVNFLKNNKKNLKAVISSGNSERHPNTFNFAGDIISKEYGVPVVAKLDKTGTEEDILKIKEALK